MITVYKYPIEIENTQTVEMPIGAKILHAGLDPDRVPCVWAEVNTDNDTEFREIHVYGTGHPMRFDSYNYVSTFIQGPFVWHVFTFASSITP